MSAARPLDYGLPRAIGLRLRPLRVASATLIPIQGCNVGDKSHNLRLVTQLLPDCYNCYRLKRADEQIDIGHRFRDC